MTKKLTERVNLPGALLNMTMRDILDKAGWFFLCIEDGVLKADVEVNLGQVVPNDENSFTGMKIELVVGDDGDVECLFNLDEEYDGDEKECEKDKDSFYDDLSSFLSKTYPADVDPTTDEDEEYAHNMGGHFNNGNLKVKK